MEDITNDKPIKEDGEAVSDVRERLQAMKRTRSALFGQVTKLQQTLDDILPDASSSYITLFTSAMLGLIRLIIAT